MTSLIVRRRNRGRALRRRERGAALVVAILVLAILTIIGIALMLITSTESRIAANEWSVNRAFYASDAGIRWAAVEMTNPFEFKTRPEFHPSVLNYLFATVQFPLPSHTHGTGFFLGDTGDTGLGNITVDVRRPSLLGRRFCSGCLINAGEEKALYTYEYEVRATGGQAATGLLQYSKAIVADLAVGPLPETLPFQ